MDTLIPYARNARTHSPEQVAQIAASIREFGFTNPILVDEEGTIIAGHGRVLAAQKLGIADLPVMVARGWSDAQRRAYVLADNQIALNAGWNNDLLKLELGELDAAGFDLGTLGFDADALGKVMYGDEGTDEDGIEAPPASSYKEQYAVMVICANETAQREAYEALIEQGYECKVVAT